MNIKMRFDSALSTDIGRTRNNNEDNFFLQGKMLPEEEKGGRFSLTFPPTESLVVGVFDGMGGEALGEVASEICARMLQKHEESILTDGQIGVEKYISEANSSVCSKIKEHKARMGSTLVVAAATSNAVRIYNIGDSRAYFWRNGAMSLISNDHTVVKQLIASGILSNADAASDPRRHQLTQHIGVFPDEMLIEPFCASPIPPESGDVFLLCSDGVTDGLCDSEISSILSSSKNANVLAKSVVAAARAAGSPDNITALVIRVISDKPTDETKSELFENRGYKQHSRQQAPVSNIRKDQIAGWYVAVVAAMLLGAAVNILIHIF